MIFLRILVIVIFEEKEVAAVLYYSWISNNVRLGC